MKVLITGGAGFVGSSLAQELLKRETVAGQEIREIVIADLYPPPQNLIADPRVRFSVGQLVEQIAALRRETFDVIFHLAAAVSAECEADFDLGLRSNLYSTHALLECLRESGNAPRFVFASSVAVFGNDPGLPMPAIVSDDTLPTPQSSYGIQKFICEQLVTDYTRKGFIEGRSARLNTVVVRPGRPNGAASGFLSSIVREPLNGHPAVCPVPTETLVAIASLGCTLEGLIAMADAPCEAIAGRTAMNLPALTVSVNEILDALEAVGGAQARELVRFEPDPLVERIVASWPAQVDSSRALRLGLSPDPDFLSIVRAYTQYLSAARG